MFIVGDVDALTILPDGSRSKLSSFGSGRLAVLIVSESSWLEKRCESNDKAGSIGTIASKMASDFALLFNVGCSDFVAIDERSDFMRVAFLSEMREF